MGSHFKKLVQPGKSKAISGDNYFPEPQSFCDMVERERHCDLDLWATLASQSRCSKEALGCVVNIPTRVEWQTRSSVRGFSSEAGWRSSPFGTDKQ